MLASILWEVPSLVLSLMFSWTDQCLPYKITGIAIFSSIWRLLKYPDDLVESWCILMTAHWVWWGSTIPHGCLYTGQGVSESFSVEMKAGSSQLIAGWSTGNVCIHRWALPVISPSPKIVFSYSRWILHSTYTCSPFWKPFPVLSSGLQTISLPIYVCRQAGFWNAEMKREFGWLFIRKEGDGNI